MPEADCSLEKYIYDKDASLSVLECLCIFENVVLGVKHLHDNGIIHRDIKPDNILMFSGVPKVSDFGLCLIVDMPRFTATEEAVGPRYYMAPELEDGRLLDVDLAADVYSLGKVLYFILSIGRVFSREKYKSEHWALSVIRCDVRFKKFDTIFDRTIVEHKFYRTDCSGILKLIQQVRDDYLIHPLTTLENKIPNLYISFDGTPLQLSSLDEDEWAELLRIRKGNNVAWSDAIMSAALNAITENTAEYFMFELVRFNEFVDIQLVYSLAAKILSTNKFIHSGLDNEDYIERLLVWALESDDIDGINSAANTFNIRNPEILNKIAAKVGVLNSESLLSFLMRSYSIPYRERESTLLWLSNHRCTNDLIGFIISGLMHVGSDATIAKCAELFRGLSDVEGNSGAFQGVILTREAHSNVKKLLECGGYNENVQMALEIIAET